jgi:alanine dehydrogenase
VVILGAGVTGMNAAAVSVGMWAETTVLDLDIEKLRRLDRMYRGQLRTVVSTSFEIEKAVCEADLVIGAVLVTGAKAPKLVSHELVGKMKQGSVLVDIAIDQGGCFEDSRPTTHSDPTYRVERSLFYCVANMPGAVPHTSTHALTNATLPYVVSIADKGLASAIVRDPSLALGVNVVGGNVVYDSVAVAHGLPSVPLADVVGQIP